MLLHGGGGGGGGGGRGEGGRKKKLTMYHSCNLYIYSEHVKLQKVSNVAQNLSLLKLKLLQPEELCGRFFFVIVLALHLIKGE